MRLLLDTSVLLLWLEDNVRIGPSARASIEDPANDVLVSAVSLWEVAVKGRIGKLRVPPAQVAAAATAAGFRPVDRITPPHLAALMNLPAHHRDPFDHLLIAQAIVELATIVTTDRIFQAYPVSVQDGRL